MKRISALNSILLIILLVAGTNCKAGDLKEVKGDHLSIFQQLLKEASIGFNSPEGYEDIKPVANSVMSYERALRHHSGKLEIRFMVRPLSRIDIDYQDPHNAEPEPNHLFPLLFEAITQALSSQGNTPNREYPPEQAQSYFNAEWAAAAVFDVDKQFSKDYTQALLIGIHKNEKADAYSLFLFNDYNQVKELIKSSLSTLAFL